MHLLTIYSSLQKFKKVLENHFNWAYHLLRHRCTIRIGGFILGFYIRMSEEFIEPVTVIYMRRTGAYGKENHVLMNNFKEWLKKQNLFDNNTAIFAIPLDDPATTEAHRCRYDVCTVYTGNENVFSDEVKARKVDGGAYATFLIKHTATDIQIAWVECFNELVRLGYTLDYDRPAMERYVKKLVDSHYCEICVPILKVSKA